jgi:hypothetical protein
MVTPHYAYNMMKMPGPHNIITVRGDPEMALECEGSRMADAVIPTEENKVEALAKYNAGVDSNDPSILKNPTTPSSAPAMFEEPASTRNVDLIPGDSSQQVSVGTGLTEA